ncbi:hypothetical protein BOQ63_006950 (plasmid) [Streptomyces viridifaciens]|uniref:DnaB-like helicase C-terminal domain-containing protein n=1 Tax=Kitasatospora aureofaciens TaxID=1894 RepID=UPI00092CB27E|nr:hypothetical protein CP971_34125 [Streptomyces viridifaciens]UKZ03810.1 hypothetical protein BOQ63_006950 [Streptomyces viridifaciens]
MTDTTQPDPAGVPRLELALSSSRPAHGKSTLALTILRACSFLHGLSAVIYSLGMVCDEIGMRLLSAETILLLVHHRSPAARGRCWACGSVAAPGRLGPVVWVS